MQTADDWMRLVRTDLDSEGVVLLRAAIHRVLLYHVIREYENTEPAPMDVIPKHEPIVVFWKHVVGEKKRIETMARMPRMWSFAQHVAELVRPLATGELRLLETIIFNKPSGVSNTLGWHQDVSYFPFEPNNQLAVWIPFDKVTRESGAMVYAIGSHKLGLRASSDLHSGKIFEGEDRAPIDVSGMETRCMEMVPGDMLIHDGRTWHMSGPNTVAGRERRGLSLRFLVGETAYKPRAGSAAAFLKQIDDIPVGARINDPAFPVL